MTDAKLIPDEVYDVCRTWYDGRDSLMGKIAYRNTVAVGDVSLVKLLAELQACENANSIDAERTKIVTAITWVETEVHQASVKAELEKAIRAAADAGVTRSEIESIFSSVMGLSR